MEKIIVQILGGFGNQLFQYAVARGISKRNNLELALDIEEFETYTLRKFEINELNIVENFATEQDLKKLNKKHILRKTLYKEKQGKFNPQILKIKKSAYLKGYWQSENYFKDIEETIRQEFTFKNHDFINNHKLLEDIKNSTSVSMSFRCGDFKSDPEACKVHNVCTMQFYKNAIAKIKEKVDDPTFYIFSDDIEWVKQNFKTDEKIIYVENTNWMEDFHFMQHCKHNISANSSFSWWAAWLNKNPQKVVVAPNKWYSDTAGIDYSKVVPEAWHKVCVEK